MKPLGFIGGLVALAVVAGSVHAETEKDANKAIQSRYHQFDKAYMSKDFPRIEEVFTPDCRFFLRDEGRSITTPKFMEGVKALSKALTVIHEKTRIVSLKATKEGWEASVIWSGESIYSPPGQERQTPPKPQKVMQSYRDTWKKTEKGWQIARRIIGN